ncbi:MAG: hypothetical protein JXA06_07675 [Bacteroidetes bacterium]|nr:hypothetical protein [Bacteroidota bacterium]
MKPISLCVAILFIAGCSGDSVDPTDIPKSSFEIYLLADSNITAYQVSQTDIDQLILRNEPWLAGEDIEFYDYSSHCIYLKGDKNQFFGGDISTYRLIGSALNSSAFVIVAGSERCYAGYFHSIVMSSMPLGPYMDEVDIGYYPADIMHISRSWWRDSIDVRSDDRIKNALISSGLYHGGISVELKSVQVIDNSDTSTIEYIFKITNNDEDKLFINDPDKMGDFFHYYTNGVVLQGEGTLLQSLYKKITEPSVDWDQGWFAEIQQGASIERTVRLKGYPPIPAGNYDCSFYFKNPHVPKQNRSLSGGRIWIGETASNRIQISVN